MRIVSGRYRGRRLVAPKGDHVRPTADRTREALFNILGDLEGIRFADLFAGSGAVGLEAASRGAIGVVLVEKDRRSLRAIDSNIETLGADLDVIRRPVGAALEALTALGPFDVIFADPPYDGAAQLVAPVLDAADRLLTAEGELIVEHRKTDPPPDCGRVMQWTRSRRYGEATLSFYRLTAGTDP